MFDQTFTDPVQGAMVKAGGIPSPLFREGGGAAATTNIVNGNKYYCEIHDHSGNAPCLQCANQKSSTKSYDRDPDGRLSTTFQRWNLSREQVLDLLESAAEKHPKCEQMFMDIKCQKDWRSSQGVGGSYSWEFFCNKAQLGPTEFLGHILREWENLKVREAKVEILNGVADVAKSTVEYAQYPKNSSDRQTVMKIAGLLKDGNDVNVNVQTQVNTLAAMNVPSADDGILKRFEILKEQ